MALETSRRDLLGLSTSGAVLALLPGCARADERPVKTSTGSTLQATARNPHEPVPSRPLGKTGANVSALGIGGSHLGEVDDDDEAMRIVHEAIDAGITFFDNAWEYHDGKSEEVLGRALVGRREKVFLMTKVCTHGRKADVAMQQLEQSLTRLRTDHLDLWQVHECVYENDPERHFANDGVITALDRAKQQGKVRFVGFTGHKSPMIHLKMLAHDYHFDTVQMPINVFDGQFRSFESLVLPEARRRQMGIIGMKSLNGTGAAVKAGIITAEEGLRYAMSAGVSTTVSGIDSLDILRQNLAVARGFVPMTDVEMRDLRGRVATQAVDGRFELYKTTIHFDGDTGRAQHGYPSQQELPL
jgi:predicted aldo/keto reductase-like oxidoreductase